MQAHAAPQTSSRDGTARAPPASRLRVSAPGDKYEREADRVADRVMRMPATPLGAAATGGGEPPPPVQTKCAACAAGGAPCPACAQAETRVMRAAVATPTLSLIQRATPEDEEELVQREVLEEDEELVQRAVSEEEDELVQPKGASSGGQGQQAAPANVAVGIGALRGGGGQPLSESARSYFEPRFGSDFSGVRVHTGPRAEGLAQALNARAFTVGSDVAFARGQFAPDTTVGKRLVAHELAHVVQQQPRQWSVAQGRIHLGHVVSRCDAPAERKAKSVASRVVDSQPASPDTISSAPSGAKGVIARRADDEDVSPSDDLIETFEAPGKELYEGAHVLSARISDLQTLIIQAIAEFADAIRNGDRTWEEHLALKFELAAYKREIYLVGIYRANPWIWRDRGEDVHDVLAKAHKVSLDEEATFALLSEEGFSTEDIFAFLLDMPDLFPEYTVGLYRSAEKEFQTLAVDNWNKFAAEVAELTKRPVDKIIPDFVWMMRKREELEDRAGWIKFFIWLDSDTPVILERREPNAASIGINDIRVHLQEHHRDWAQYLHPELNEDLKFLYPALEYWNFFNIYDRLGRQMRLFRIVVESTYERLNERFSMPDVVSDLRRTYSSQSPQVSKDVRREGFRKIYTTVQRVLDSWVAGLSWDERIREGFGLYDVLGEIGTTLRALASLEAIAAIAGFVAFIIAVQAVPFGNIIVDASLISLMGLDILKGIFIFGRYFDRASEARTFSRLFYSAQDLKGGGEVILGLLVDLMLFGAGKSLGSYSRYRKTKQLKNLDEIADHDVIKHGRPEIRKAFEDARASEKAVSRWKQTLDRGTQEVLDSNRQLRRLYDEMDPVVRELLTLCNTPCIPLNPPPLSRDIQRIKDLLNRLGLKGDDRGLKEYLHARRQSLTKAIDDIEDVKDIADLRGRLGVATAGRGVKRKGEEIWGEIGEELGLPPGRKPPKVTTEKAVEDIAGPPKKRGLYKGKKKRAQITIQKGGLLGRARKSVNYPGKAQLNWLRRTEFPPKRAAWMKKMASDQRVIDFFGPDSSAIRLMRKGEVPPGYQVHHNYPLAAGGKNVESNFTLIPHEIHTRVTSEFEAVRKGAVEFDFPVFDDFVPGILTRSEKIVF